MIDFYSDSKINASDIILSAHSEPLFFSEYESDSLENTRSNTPELKSNRDFQEELKNQFGNFKITFFRQKISQESMKKAPKQSDNSTRLLELDLEHVKERLAAKEREVEGLYRQILNQDKAFAESYREQEASFREREEKLIVKLFDEVDKNLPENNSELFKGKVANKSANRAAAQDRRARRANSQFTESTRFFSKK